MKRIFLMSALALLALTACDALTVEKPYEAKTVEECIREKECVRSALIPMAFRIGASEEKNRIQKWERPVNVSFLSVEGDKIKYNSLLQEKILDIKGHLPIPLRLQKTSNFIFIFSNWSYRPRKKDVRYSN